MLKYPQRRLTGSDTYIPLDEEHLVEPPSGIYSQIITTMASNGNVTISRISLNELREPSRRASHSTPVLLLQRTQ